MNHTCSCGTHMQPCVGSADHLYCPHCDRRCELGKSRCPLCAALDRAGK